MTSPTTQYWDHARCDVRTLREILVEAFGSDLVTPTRLQYVDGLVQRADLTPLRMVS